MKSHIFGIHVGNSMASLAIYKEDGKIEVLTNEVGERITPAVVSIINNEKIVGSVAKSLLLSNCNCTITNNKRLMNKSSEVCKIGDIREERRVRLECVNQEWYYHIPTEGKTKLFTPAKVCTLIYAKLRQIAKSAAHVSSGDIIACVVLVPTYFNAESIKYTKRAIEDAGWTILQFIKEPTAPVLAYSLLEKSSVKQEETLVLVYRLGGVSCEATVVKIYHGMVNILCTSYRDNCGADHLLTQLTNYLAQVFFTKYKVDPKENAKSMGKLNHAAEDCMHVLSNLNIANCFVESLCEGVDFSHSLTRARLESCLSPLLSMYMEPIHDVLKSTNLEAKDIEKVIYCGGALNIPRLQSHLKQMFSESEVLSGLAPDEVLAYGAAKQAGYLVAYTKKIRQEKSKIFGNALEDHVLPLTYPVDFAVDNIDVIVLMDCKDIHFGSYSITPSNYKIDLSKYIISDEDTQTFIIKIITGPEKLEGKVTIIPNTDFIYEVAIQLSKNKKLEIKLINTNRFTKERHVCPLLLEPALS